VEGTDAELHRALDQHLRDERERRIRNEAKRLRAAGFVLEAELDGRPLWRRNGGSYWHEEAIATLEAQESA
jgi:hypothetical protein